MVLVSLRHRRNSRHLKTWVWIMSDGMFPSSMEHFCFTFDAIKLTSPLLFDYTLGMI